MTKLVLNRIHGIAGIDTATRLGRWLTEAWAARRSTVLPAGERLRYDIGESDCRPGPELPAERQIVDYTASFEAMLNRLI